MKPWGSQVRSAHFSVLVFLRQQREARGVQGAAMSPLVAGTMPAKSWHGCPRDAGRVGTLCPSVGAVLGCTRLCELRRCCRASVGSFEEPNPCRVRRRRPCYLDTPRRPFVTDSLG